MDTKFALREVGIEVLCTISTNHNVQDTVYSCLPSNSYELVSVCLGLYVVR